MRQKRVKKAPPARPELSNRMRLLKEEEKMRRSFSPREKRSGRAKILRTNGTTQKRLNALTELPASSSAAPADSKMIWHDSVTAAAPRGAAGTDAVHELEGIPLRREGDPLCTVWFASREGRPHF